MYVTFHNYFSLFVFIFSVNEPSTVSSNKNSNVNDMLCGKKKKKKEEILTSSVMIRDRLRYKLATLRLSLDFSDTEQILYGDPFETYPFSLDHPKIFQGSHRDLNGIESQFEFYA